MFTFLFLKFGLRKCKTYVKGLINFNYNDTHGEKRKGTLMQI